MEFLRANGIEDPGYLRELDYQEVLNSQELMGEELELFARKETQKDVSIFGLGVKIINFAFLTVSFSFRSSYQSKKARF